MNSAAQTKRIVVVSLMAAALAAVFLLHAEEDRFGPYICNHCPLQNPPVDPVTEEFIDSTRPLGAIGVPWEDDDVYVICNAAYCVDYRRTYPQDSYEGDNVRPVQDGGDGGIGGGGGNETGGSGGGYNPGPGGGGGSSGGGSGKVIVGDPTVVDN